MPPIRAILFDFDGLIVDTESVGYQTWHELYAKHGHDLPVEIYAQAIGTEFNDLYDPRRDLDALMGKALLWEELEEGRRVRETELRTSLVTLPGVIDRLEEARALGLPCAVASSSPLSWVGGWIEQLGLRPYFHHLTTLDDTGKVKPDPSLFLHAADRMGVEPEHILVFEDSLNGLRAAKAAEMRCIVVPGPMTRHLNFEGALRRVGSLAEVSLQELVEK
ncbi:putative hydrolase of the HAD superfamily [Prosthecobacter fusiformis]|uniref:Putative hydrolase of the HAD superfamily n=1 Tax=Prosthecobacter fusiformis TaxID=48464 RepID=A0A4V3FIA8_9BACT|nr:HAD family hydrolase [Prosthecobacter fusiformis]TDU81663.1 putative hydrolase of the HAD superfamily [Prosthecobacter fusiformis]